MLLIKSYGISMEEEVGLWPSAINTLATLADSDIGIATSSIIHLVAILHVITVSLMAYFESAIV